MKNPPLKKKREAINRLRRLDRNGPVYQGVHQFGIGRIAVTARGGQPQTVGDEIAPRLPQIAQQDRMIGRDEPGIVHGPGHPGSLLRQSHIVEGGQPLAIDLNTGVLTAGRCRIEQGTCQAVSAPSGRRAVACPVLRPDR